MATGPRSRLRPKPITGSGMLGATQSGDAAAQGDDTLPGPRAGHLQVAPAPAAGAPAEPQGPGPDPGPQLPAVQDPGPPEAGLPEVQEDAELPVAGTMPQAQTFRRQQITVLVSVDVRDRFDKYRKVHDLKNTAVVIDALNAAYGRYGQLVRARQPQARPGLLFGDAVPGRRLTNEVRKATQLVFYFTEREAANLKMVVTQATTNQSALVDAVLDDFLPALGDIVPPSDGRRGSGRAGKASRGQ